MWKRVPSLMCFYFLLPLKKISEQSCSNGESPDFGIGFRLSTFCQSRVFVRSLLQKRIEKIINLDLTCFPKKTSFYPSNTLHTILEESPSDRGVHRIIGADSSNETELNRLLCQFSSQSTSFLIGVQEQ